MTVALNSHKARRVIGRYKVKAFKVILNLEGARQVEDRYLFLGLVADFYSSLLRAPTFCLHEIPHTFHNFQQANA